MCPLPQTPAKNLASETEILNITNNLLRLESGSRSRTSQVIQVRSRKSVGVATPGEVEGRGRGHPLSAQVLLRGVPLIFPLLAVALVMWLVALAAFAAGGGALLVVVGRLVVGARHPGLRKEETHTGSAFQNPAGRPHTHHTFTGIVLRSATTCPGHQCYSALLWGNIDVWEQCHCLKPT